MRHDLRHTIAYVSKGLDNETLVVALTLSQSGEEPVVF